MYANQCVYTYTYMCTYIYMNIYIYIYIYIYMYLYIYIYIRIYRYIIEYGPCPFYESDSSFWPLPGKMIVIVAGSYN